MIISKNVMAALLMLLSCNAWSTCFNDNRDGTVKDCATGLTWQQSDAHNNFGRNYSTAIAYCHGLGLAGGGWRLPAIKELISIVDFRSADPSIDVVYFTGSLSLPYWSVSYDVQASGEVWAVHFLDGNVFSYDATDGYFVRCVR